MSRILIIVALGISTIACPGRSGPSGDNAAATPKPVDAATIADAKAKLIARHGESNRARIERGVDQVAQVWRADDGKLVDFCVEQFVVEPKGLDALFDRMQAMFEQIDGHFLELGRSLRWATEVESGDILPVDALFAAYDAGARMIDDLFAAKVGFVALLNFPLTGLDDRLRDGPAWSRRRWAEARLTDRFETRIPGDLILAVSAAMAAADQYIASYNVWMHHVVDDAGKRQWPQGKRLISHWNLRDELKAAYADKQDGLARQRTIAKVMERIVTQQIPRAVIDNPKLDWNPFANTVVAAPAAAIEKDAPATATATPSTERELDRRFENVLAHFRAQRAVDPHVPRLPTFIARTFEEAELPEQRVRAMLVAILGSPHVARAAKEIQARLGRPLEPHDLWYEFGGGSVSEAELDDVTRKKYPTADAFAADVPRILRDLGFTADKATFLAERIAVDPSRGAGHAMQASRRGDKAHLRTRVEKGGMDYKGYNIAVHELGHNVEQVFSLYSIDYTLLAGVPNTAFTEALAFLFQDRDLDLLGRASRDPEIERLRVLDSFWNGFEIAGSSLVEIDVWQWLYDHPAATAAELRDATVRIARDVWNRYYAPVLGGKDTVLLGIYSHTIAAPLYLFNYVLGQVIAFQVEEHVAGKDKATFAAEFERASRLGTISPDLWMQQVTGSPVTEKPLLDATARALDKQ